MITAPKIDVYTEAEAKELAAELQQLMKISTYCGNAAAAIRHRVILALRVEGLDSGSSLASRFLGTTAERAASRIVQPLNAIESECYSAAQAAVLFDRRFTQLCVEPIRQARAAKKQPNGGAIRVS